MKLDGKEIELKEGMLFKHKEKGIEDTFSIRKWDYYGVNKAVWCAFTLDGFILPLTEIVMNEYEYAGMIKGEQYGK